jgi:hypothetical protein
MTTAKSEEVRRAQEAADETLREETERPAKDARGWHSLAKSAPDQAQPIPVESLRPSISTLASKRERIPTPAGEKRTETWRVRKEREAKRELDAAERGFGSLLRPMPYVKDYIEMVRHRERSERLGGRSGHPGKMDPVRKFILMTIIHLFFDDGIFDASRNKENRAGDASTTIASWRDSRCSLGWKLSNLCGYDYAETTIEDMYSDWIAGGFDRISRDAFWRVTVEQVESAAVDWASLRPVAHLPNALQKHASGKPSHFPD